MTDSKQQASDYPVLEIDPIMKRYLEQTANEHEAFLRWMDHVLCCNDMMKGHEVKPL